MENKQIINRMLGGKQSFNNIFRLGGNTNVSFFEGIVMCFILLMYCVVGIRNGAVGLVCLYEKDVQERVVELGLVTKEQIKKQFLFSSIVLFIPLFTLIPYMVYGVNGVFEFGGDRKKSLGLCCGIGVADLCGSKI